MEGKNWSLGNQESVISEGKDDIQREGEGTQQVFIAYFTILFGQNK